MEKYTDEKSVPIIEDLAQLIEELHKVYAEERINVEYVRALLSSYKSNPKDWKKYAQTDPHRYVIYSLKYVLHFQFYLYYMYSNFSKDSDRFGKFHSNCIYRPALRVIFRWCFILVIVIFNFTGFISSNYDITN